MINLFLFQKQQVWKLALLSPTYRQEAIQGHLLVINFKHKVEITILVVQGYFNIRVIFHVNLVADVIKCEIFLAMKIPDRTVQSIFPQF